MTPPGSPLHYVVLLVDDDAAVLRLLGKVLEGMPVSIEVATNADEALEHFEANRSPPELVIADYNMPGRNGIELLTLIRQQSRHTTLALHSALTPPFVPKGIAILPKPSGAAKVRDFVADRLTAHTLRIERDHRREALAAAF